MDRITVDKFQFPGGWLRPAFGESAVARIDAQGSFSAEDFDRERVEEFVGEDDGRNVAAGRLVEFSSSGFEMISQSLFDPLAQGGRTFEEDIAQGAIEVRKLLFRPVKNVLCKQASAGAEFEQFDSPRRTQGSPHFVELPRQKSAENGVDVA